MSTDRNDEVENDDTTKPHGKRDGRESSEPRSQPGEFADEMHVNRFTDPPPPAPKRNTEH